jgi:hypothetical protein
MSGTPTTLRLEIEGSHLRLSVERRVVAKTSVYEEACAMGRQLEEALRCVENRIGSKR